MGHHVQRLRYVDELPYHDPDHSPESRELANHTSVGRPHAISSSIEETRASQSKTQSNLMNNQSEDILAHAEANGKTLECRMSKKVTNLVRFLDYKGSRN